MAVLLIAGSLVGLFRDDAQAAITSGSPASYSSVSAGANHACAIASGAIYCWGDNSYGQLGNNTTTNSSIPVAVDTSGVLAGKTITSISSGGYYTCAVASSAAYCWGDNTYGQLGNNSTTQSNVPVAVDTSGVLAGTTVTAVSTGSSHTCAVASSAAYCWGENSSGKLGNNTTTQSLVPVAVDTSGVLAGTTVTAVSTGSSHTCAVASSAAYCWGDNTYGQLGNNTTTASSVPVAVYTKASYKSQGKTYPASPLYGKTVDSLSGGSSHTCAVASGAASCWGGNFDGQLGNNSTTQSNVPVAVDTSGVLAGKTITAISSGDYHTCAVASGTASCWGFNPYGELGNNTTTQSLVPVAVDTSGVLAGKTITMISSGSSHSCAIASSVAYCWGYNTDGELGNNSTTNSSVPVIVKGNAPLYSSANRVFANANSIQPGAPLAATNQAATLTSGGEAFRVRTGIVEGTTPAVSAITNGSSHTCALSAGAAYCWGYNFDGELGNNTTTQSLVPVAVDTSGVLAGKTITAISSGDYHTCVLASGSVYCWGDNSYGQLGNNSTTLSSIPVAVDTSGVLAGKTITSVASGSDQTCAIASGAAYCWGDNTFGQLGNNSTTQSNVPVAADTSGVLAGKTITAISSGKYHTCVIAAGAEYCWGYNYDGELGNNSTTDSSVPVAVDTSGALAGKTISAIYNGYTQTCAIASGVVYCWGNNHYGQLGNNSTTNSSVPVAVDTSGVLAGKTISSVTSGSSQTCATASNAAYCWGYNTDGELGNNSTTDSSIPVAVDTSGVLAGTSVSAISSGNTHTCAIASSAAYCWGNNSNGQLGNNSTSNSLVPIATNYVGAMSAPLLAGDNLFSLQFALKTAATCALQSTGYAAITSTSAIAWNTNSSVTNGASISSNVNDPTDASSTTYETYVDSGASFTNTQPIPASSNGLWDFSLKDNSGLSNTSYCIQVVYANGSGLETHTDVPEVVTASIGLGLGFVDNNNNTVSLPSFTMSPINQSSTCQVSTGAIGSTSGTMLQVKLSGASAYGFNVSIAPTNGDTSLWTRNDNGAFYDFNDPSGSPPGCNSGSDGDGYAGQLSVDTSTTTVTPQAGCSTSGISTNSGTAAYSSGVLSAITLLSASSSVSPSCYWDMAGTTTTSTVPANQALGTYTLQLSATVVAQ